MPNLRKFNEGLPLMLGYKISKDYSEILMTHGGDNMETWMKRVSSQTTRMHMAAEMLRQGISAIKTLHEIGFVHGDMKPANICLRITKKEKFKFSVIDFGVCQKLPDINRIQKKNK